MNANQFARLQLSHMKQAALSTRIENGVTQTEALVEVAVVTLDEIMSTELDPAWNTLLCRVSDILTEYGVHLGETR